MKRKAEYKICAAYDTETTNIGKGNETRAFVSLYIINDLRNISLNDYVADETDTILFFRFADEFLNYIDELVKYGITNNFIPIICAYNLMFDLQTVIYSLNEKYKLEINAQSSTNAYTLDLYIEDTKVLRFWDTFHLEQRGLAAMGETCGLNKATGSWDYSKIRTPFTELTQEELFYAKRDVQVIPAYLNYLLNANSWLHENDLGLTVITKTSLVRQMAKNDIGKLKVKKQNNKTISLNYAFNKLCMQELPKSYEIYALRKACFRGGFTFTAASTASQIVKNVYSLDVTSMHHAFINGRMQPVHFTKDKPLLLDHYVKTVVNTSIDDVLKNYEKPFPCAFHMKIEFINLKIKKNSAFDDWKIALIPYGKFKKVSAKTTGFNKNERAQAAETYIKNSDFVDSAFRPVFAFGKLYECEKCTLFLNEIELWCIAQVYEWESYKCILGEGTINFIIPPDYVTLQSNLLFKTKNDAKVINKNYKEGKNYPFEIPGTIPANMAKELKNGSMNAKFFESYYNSTVKGMFNGIYGTQAQDIFKPDFMVENGEIFINSETKATKENFEEKIPKKCKVFYNYGMRIVAGSRMHLIIAIIKLYEALKNKIVVTGGDTDSLKISCNNAGEQDLLSALGPLHEAVTNAINTCMKRIRKLFPKMASSLEHIGCFEIENSENAYLYHMETWNKARVSIDRNMKAHITCAGLSRPIKSFNIEDFINILIKKYPIEDILKNVLAYNVYVDYNLCFSLEHHRPKPTERIQQNITDYKNNTYFIDQYEAISLFETGRYIGDTTKIANAYNVDYLKKLNYEINTDDKILVIEDNEAKIIVGDTIEYSTKIL